MATRHVAISTSRDGSRLSLPRGIAVMGLDELRLKLAELKSGEALGIHYVTFAELFPPGEQDPHARETCARFSAAAGCSVEYKPTLHGLFFVKQ